MKYREDMMESCKKSPGMCSDRPETTPKSHDLVVSPTCLREKEPFGGLVRVGGGKRKGHIYISQFWLTPLFCAGADCPRPICSAQEHKIALNFDSSII